MITESDSLHNDLDKMSTSEILEGINGEDLSVAAAVQKSLRQVENLIDASYPIMREGGRLFYIGAGTSGRLGVVDASECPPTFGVDFDVVVGLIAGGDGAIRKAVEFAEDDPNAAQKDLENYHFSEKDILVGLAASGRTPYVIGGLKYANKLRALTGCITCNPESELARVSKFPIEIIVGPEFLTGSTRMKAGTAQKMALNMISTSLMIKLGHVKGNRMVDMQLSNEKLVDRGTKMIMQSVDMTYSEANALLNQFGSVRAALESLKD